MENAMSITQYETHRDFLLEKVFLLSKQYIRSFSRRLWFVRKLILTHTAMFPEPQYRLHKSARVIALNQP